MERLPEKPKDNPEKHPEVAHFNLPKKHLKLFLKSESAIAAICSQGFKQVDHLIKTKIDEINDQLDDFAWDLEPNSSMSSMAQLEPDSSSELPSQKAKPLQASFMSAHSVTEHKTTESRSKSINLKSKAVKEKTKVYICKSQKGIPNLID